MTKYFVPNSYFRNIPGQPIAYWISAKMNDSFQGNALSCVAETKQGFATGDNNRFLRFWFEVEESKSNYTATDIDDAKKSKKKWFPCNKGGEYRKWYGNNNYVVNWENDGKEMKNTKNSVIRNPQFYFREGLTWSSLANKLSVRYSREGFLFESKGSMCFMAKSNDSQIYELLGLLNCKVVTEIMKVLSPTLDFHEGPMSKVPVKSIDIAEIETLVKENIKMSKDEWDSYETSWEFKGHPLI